MGAEKKHGAAGNVRSKNGRTRPTPEYQAWVNLRRRCDGRSKTHKARYRDRGIRVCDRWRDFTAFLADVGPRPAAGLSIERIDNNRGYEPGNVRWAKPTTQTRNREVTQINELGVVLARAAVARGSARSDVAHAFGLQPAALGKIVRGERWRDALEVLACQR